LQSSGNDLLNLGFIFKKAAPGSKSKIFDPLPFRPIVRRRMSGNAQMEARLRTSLASFQSTIIDLDVKLLGGQIMRLIKDVGQLQVVTIGDLTVFGKSENDVPADVSDAMRYGTKFFDAVYYFSLETSVRPTIAAGVDLSAKLAENMMLTKKRLLWTAIFLMLRGSYPESKGMTMGSDVPAFLSKICMMTESPFDCASGLASFNLGSINPNWIREINWSQFAAPIRQRLGLGLAGYRALAPFKLYECRPEASDEAKKAFKWVRAVTQAPLDYAILSCTRDAALIARLGSFNQALGNLMLECFTRAQIQEMETAKIIYQIPTRDPRADTWRAWTAGGPLSLNDPIGLN